ncbi:hypothetical protein NIES267_71910 (plasmid) [Calothrix parasitica NIES-267]|uniref:Uncharacterized protein n=1 Tax=Calothrix parasitica NIES-267 TaxID=1973488 RepID=A0A1Z4M2H5_9CYAN|nr:hypothetical protein NIES267_71910 [Calothrix parasitica NIES-267]
MNKNLQLPRSFTGIAFISLTIATLLTSIGVKAQESVNTNQTEKKIVINSSSKLKLSRVNSSQAIPNVKEQIQTRDFKIAQRDYRGLINILIRALENARVEIRDYALTTAREISPNNVRWNDAVPEIVWNEGEPFLRVTLYGKVKVKILRDKNVRLTLNFQPDDELNFRYLAPHQLHISRCRIRCKKKRKKFNRELTQILEERRDRMEEAINTRVDEILS